MPKTYTIVFFFSLTLVAVAIVLTGMFGLRYGVDFKGGTILELGFQTTPAIADIQKALTDSGIKEFSVSPLESGVIIRSDALTEEQHQALVKKLQITFVSAQMVEKRFDSVGPSIGQELKSKSSTAIILVLLVVMSYIAYVFRKLGKLFSPWILGFAALLALLHDVIIPTGIFSVLGKFYGVEITAVFVAAVLTVLGYSVSDTVVVFDRVRENVIRYGLKEDFGAVVHRSIMQTLSRSLNTTLTTILSLLAIYFFGGESIKYFALALILGITFGAYSSIFVASPLLVFWWNRKHGK